MNVWDLLLNSKDLREVEDEEDIKRTCNWLKEAGFPQYVQMYNDGEFPISLKLVQEDHCDFDGGSLMALFRRIEILNKSAENKSETRIEEFSSTRREIVTITSKPKYVIIEDENGSENEDDEDDDDEDDDKENVLEQTALSSNWSYEHSTRRWSHIESIKSQTETLSDNSKSTLQQYLGVSLPKPFVSKPIDKSKRPSNLNTDFHQIFDPIPENNLDILDADHAAAGMLQTVTSDKDNRLSASLSNDSRDSGDCLSPTSPDSGGKDKSSHILRSKSLKFMKAVSRLSPHQLSIRHHKRGKHDHIEATKLPGTDDHEARNSSNLEDGEQLRSLKFKDDISVRNSQHGEKSNKLVNESFHIGDAGWINARTGSFISRTSNQFDDDGKKSVTNVISNLDPIISLLESDVDSLDQMRSKIKLRSSSGSAPNSPVLRKKPGEVSDVDNSNARLSDFESYTRLKENGPVNNIDKSNNRISLPPSITREPEADSTKLLSISPKISRNSATRRSYTSYRNGKEKAPKLYKLMEFSVTQVNILKKLSVLGCTSMLEKYCPSQKNVFNWRLPRLLPQKQKVSLEDTAKVFGVNLSICQIRFGQPYPPAILNIFQYLREQGPSSEGIFRKAGMKARSKTLRAEIEKNPNLNTFDEYSVFDVADVLKGFLRDLPDRLLTGKLSATLMAIYSYVPKEQQIEGLQLALLSLPDENRTALEILIEFLSFLSSHSKVTMMDVSNLSLLFCPNLFNFPTDTNVNNSIGPLRMKKNNGPNVKQLAEQSAAHLCTMDMILNLHTIFQVTDETLKKNHNKMYNAEPKDISSLLSTGHWQEWLYEKISQLKADTVNHKSGWTNISKDTIRKLHGTNSLVEQLSYRKIGSQNNNSDGIALRTWKVVIDIDVSPGYLFTNIKDKRHIWDESITTTELLQEMSDYVDLVSLTSCNPDGSSVPRCFNLLRGHQLGVGGSSHMIIAESVNVHHLMALSSPRDSGIGGSELIQSSPVTGQVFCDNFMLEASSTRTTRVTWISRVDLRGHHSDWYSAHWGHDLVKRATGLKLYSESSASAGSGGGGGGNATERQTTSSSSLASSPSVSVHGASAQLSVLTPPTITEPVSHPPPTLVVPDAYLPPLEPLARETVL